MSSITNICELNKLFYNNIYFVNDVDVSLKVLYHTRISKVFDEFGC